MKKFLFFCFWVMFCAKLYALPAGYTRLGYLQTDGQTYIDTGIQLNSASKFEFKFSTAVLKNCAVFGASNGKWYDRGEISVFYNTIGGKVIEAVRPTSNALSTVVSPKPYITPNENYTIYYDKDNLIVNGTAQSSNWYSDYVGNRTAYLFGTNRGSSSWICGDTKIYYFKIYNGNTLIRDFIPVRRNSDGVLGMYDMVSNTFFTNAGSGTFIASAIDDSWIVTASYVAGMYDAIDNVKMAKLNQNSIEYTQDSSQYGFISSVVGAGDKLRVTRSEITIPVGTIDSSDNRSSIWIQ